MQIIFECSGQTAESLKRLCLPAIMTQGHTEHAPPGQFWLSRKLDEAKQNRARSMVFSRLPATAGSALKPNLCSIGSILGQVIQITSFLE